MYSIINLTPHAVNIVGKDGSIKTFEPSGYVLRLQEVVEEISPIDAIPRVKKRLEGVDAESLNFFLENVLDGLGLLEAVKNGDITPYFVVSLAVAQAARGFGFLVPDDLVRDEEGKILGARRLAYID